MTTKLNSIKKVEVIGYPDGHGSITFHRTYGARTYRVLKEKSERGLMVIEAIERNEPTRVVAISDYRSNADILRGELGY